MLSGRVFSAVFPALLTFFTFYLYTFSTLHQPIQRSATAFVSQDDDHIQVGVSSRNHPQAIQVPLLSASSENDRSIQASLGLHHFRCVTVIESCLCLLGVALALRLILTHSTLFSICLLFFLLVCALSPLHCSSTRSVRPSRGPTPRIT